MMRARVFLLGVVFCLLCVFDARLVRADDAVDAVLRRLEHAAQGVSTLQGDFVQTKRLTLFAEDVVSRGRIAFERPDRLRWEYVEPMRSGFTISGQNGMRWNELSGGQEAFNTGRDPMMCMVLENLLAWIRVDADWLKRRYEIKALSESPPELDLAPLDGPARKFLERFIVRFSDDGTHVNSVIVRERGGDFTQIVFSHAILNAPLPAGTF